MNQSKDTATDAVGTPFQQANSSPTVSVDAIQRISDMNIQIASAAEEQSLVVEEIPTTTYAKIKDLSTQVSTAAQEANTAMQVQNRQCSPARRAIE